MSAIDELDNGRTEIVLLAARRMTCIYALVHEAGLPEPSKGVVISDRFAQLMSPKTWLGRKILVVDDTTITGHTRRERRRIAEQLAGPQGSVRDRVAVTIKRSDKHASFDLHNEFALAFGEGLMPFFTDFPVTRPVSTTPEVLDSILAARHLWRTVNVTNAVTSGSGARAYSLFPVDGLVDELRRELGTAASLLDIVKLRLYIHETASEVRMRFVPLVLTRALLEPSLNVWIEKVGLTPLRTPEQAAQAMGLVSFMLSRKLLSVFAPIAEREFGLLVAEDTSLTRILLGTELNDVADLKNLSSLGWLKSDVELEQTDAADPVFKWPESKADSGWHYVAVGDDLARPGFECLRQTQKSIGRRRRAGWQRHAATLGSIAESAGTNRLSASLAVDILNDLGYAVPAPMVHRGLVFRGYRAGEAALREYRDLDIGAQGGRLAAFVETIEIDDAVYFDAPKPVDVSQ
jgi:hypothetical protein